MIDNFLNLVCLEVRKTDCANLSFLIRLLQHAPGIEIIVYRMMQQHHINIVNPESDKCIINGRVLFIKRRPQLCLKKVVFPFHTGFF